MTKSVTVSVYPIVAALWAARKSIIDFNGWRPSNAMQELFIQNYYDLCCDEVQGISCIKSSASQNSEKINDFLRQAGSSVRLPSLGVSGLSLAAILDLLVEWPQRGELRDVTTEDKCCFPGVRICEGNVTFFHIPPAIHRKPVACVKTNSGHLVYMTMRRQVPEGFDLIELIRNISRQKRPIHDYGGLVFPMASLDQTFALPWLSGLQLESEMLPLEVIQAIQWNKLRLNEVGARVQSTVIMKTIFIGLNPNRPNPDLVINGPFLFWVEDPTLRLPLFVAYVQRDDWRNPGDITAA